MASHGGSLVSQRRQVAFNDDAQWWATAAYYAYRAYGDKSLLDHAVATWNHVSQLYVFVRRPPRNDP
jgi:hypothetical protein